MIRYISKEKNAPQVLFVAAMLWATMTALIFCFWPTEVHASTLANIKIAAAAKVLNVTVWSFGAPDPHAKGEKVDIYSVTLKNASKPSRALDYVAVNLSARDHGQPAVLETIIEASDGYPLVKAMPWVLPLKPGMTKTVFFVTRSNGDQYCAGGTLLKPQKCTPHG